MPSRLDLPSGVLSVYSHDRFAFEELVTEGLKEIVLQTEMAVAHVRSVRETKTALEETAAAINTLRETEQRFRLAFEDNMAPMIFSDLEDRAIAVNDAFCQMVGFTREELLGHDSAQFTYPDDADKIQYHYRRGFEDAFTDGVRLIDGSPRKGAEGLSIAFVHPGSACGVLTEFTEFPPRHS